MSAAQRLFADGVISYHRTDSTVLSDRALSEAGTAIRDLYGSDFHAGPRRYRTQVQNAQEAHEAVRPTDFARTPQLAGGLGDDERRLYELIWKRAVASQMTDAQLLRTSLEITAIGPDGPSVFVATGRATRFAGYLRAYVEGTDDPAAELGDQETLLPRVAVGDEVTPDGPLALEALDPKGHETTPPPRYTDATLVKRLEDDGIGRPSTYASIITTIERRGYVWRDAKALVPTFTAYAVTKLLTEHFGPLVELGFTGMIEGDLDEIARGTRARDDFLATFYTGGGDWPGLQQLVEAATDIEYPVISLGNDPDTGAPVVVRIGRFGPYVQVGEGDEARNASVPEDVAPADLTLERAIDLVATRARGPASLGDDLESGLPVFVLSGRYGPYVQLGPTPEDGAADKPRRASLTADDDPVTIDLDRALQLLSLPRTVGVDPESGTEVVANFGRYGPYVKRGDEFRSLANDAAVFAVTIDEALELLRQPRPGRRAAARTVLRELGAHPESAAPVQLLDGRYGPYVTDGTTNASLPREMSPDTVTLESAVVMLRAKAAAGPTKRPRRRSGSGSRKPGGGTGTGRKRSA
jgi:DNA topoisomerase-1